MNNEKMIISLIDTLICNKASCGTRRNYCIKLYDDTAVLRTKKMTCTSAYLYELCEHHIRWIYFSKIKDAREALKEIEKLGYKVTDTTI